MGFTNGLAKEKTIKLMLTRRFNGIVSWQKRRVILLHRDTTFFTKNKFAVK